MSFVALLGLACLFWCVGTPVVATCLLLLVDHLCGELPPGERRDDAERRAMKFAWKVSGCIAAWFVLENWPKY